MNGSLFYPQNFKIKRSRIFFAKLGWINFVKHRQIEGEVKSITIIQDGEQWNISICSELELEIKEKAKPLLELLENANIIGIDVGIKEFATFSDETVISNPRTLNKYLSKLKKNRKNYPKNNLLKKLLMGRK